MEELKKHLSSDGLFDELSEENKEFLRYYFQYLYAEKNYSEHTLRAYLNDILEFLNYLEREERNIHEVDVTDLRSYFTMRTGSNFRSKSPDQRFVTGITNNRKLGARSQARKLSAVRSFYQMLYLRNKIKINPAKAMTSPKMYRSLPETVRGSDINRIFSETREKTKTKENRISKTLQIRDTAIYEALYSSGMRISELLGLKLSDLHSDLSQLKICGKGNKERFVFLGEEARNALRNYLAVRNQFHADHEFVFVNFRGEPLNPRGVRHRMGEITIEKDLKGRLHPHKFRHAFAVDMMNAGADIRAVQELLGHSSLSTTQIYTRITKDRLQEVYRNCHPHGKQN